MRSRPRCAAGCHFVRVLHDECRHPEAGEPELSRSWLPHCSTGEEALGSRQTAVHAQQLERQ